MNTKHNAYDALPYPNLIHFRTHPIRNAALASLYGIDTPDVGSARVLELGCAAGANLMQMASELPDATFVGVDLSSGQIEEGRQAIATVGLRNVSLHDEDVANIDQSWGQFDYIIAHGLFSWVPGPVQDQILRVCQENLSASGIAFMSYNVFPGWHSRQVVRDIMMQHDNPLAAPGSRVEQARAMLDFMAEHAKAGFYAELLKGEAKKLREADAGYLFHEFLERDNNPILFSGFVDKARAHQLEYLSDTLPFQASPGAQDAKLAHALQALSGGDPVRMEQHLDFVNNRSFRESLLVHGNLKFSRTLDPDRISRLWMTCTSEYEKTQAVDLVGSQPMQIVTVQGHKLQLRDPLAKAAMIVLDEQDGLPMQFAELLERVHGKLSPAHSLTATQAALSRFLLDAYKYSAVEFFTLPWSCTSVLSEKPCVTPLARYQARMSRGRGVVTRKRRIIKGMNADHRQLIEWLDGSHSIPELVDMMVKKIDANLLPGEVRQAVQTGARSRSDVEGHVRQILDEFARLGLLVQ